MSYHLAELNIARARTPLDDPAMGDFVRGLDQINALAETSPGFVWRFQSEDGNAMSVRVFDDPRVIVNLSVWKSIDELKDYSFKSMHAQYFARRREWFDKMETPHLVMWWIPAGTLPTMAEAKSRLAQLAERGSTAQAFDFRNPFPSPA